jgi:hypothetical protein
MLSIARDCGGEMVSGTAERPEVPRTSAKEIARRIVANLKRPFHVSSDPSHPRAVFHPPSCAPSDHVTGISPDGVGIRSRYG